MSREQNPAARLRFSAMNSLARREHSRGELARKLEQKFPGHRELVPEVLDRLEAQGLQSDTRYVEAFCRARVGRGQGRARISNELRLKGVAEAAVDRALAELDVDWFELAREVARRRFGESRAREPKEIARRMRFLRYRGFDQEQIQYALESQDGQ